MRIGQTSFVVFVSKLVGSALGFLATIYFARVLGAEVLGYYFLVVAIVSWLKLGGELGISRAVTKRISEGTDRSAFFTAGAMTIGAMGVLLSLGVVLARGPLERYVGAPVAGYLVAMLLTVLFMAHVRSGLQGEHLVHISGLLSPIRITVRSVIQLGLIFAGWGLSGMLLGWITGTVLVGLIGLLFLSVDLARPERRHFESILAFAKFSWLGNLRGRAYNDADLIVLGALVPASLVGVYAVAWSIASFLILFGSAVSSTLFPEISRADAEGSDETVARYVNDALAFAGLIIVPGLVGGAILAERILRIYGPEFTRGTAVFALLVLAVLFYTYQNQLLNALNAIDRPDVAFRINAAFIAVNVVLNVGLVLLIGFVGAAIATAVSTGLGLALAFLAARRLISFEVPTGELARQGLAACLMGAVVLGGHLFFEYTGLVRHNAGITVFLVGLGGAVYFLALWVLSDRFRATLIANSPVELPVASR